MKQLNRLQNAIFISGAVLMIAGAAVRMAFKDIASWLFAIGALAFVFMQVQQRYDGNNFTLQRLRRIVLMSDVLLILTAALMFADEGNPLGLDHLTWLNYVHNNWLVLLLIAALIQLYTVFRIDAELKKEAKKR